MENHYNELIPSTFPLGIQDYLSTYHRLSWRNEHGLSNEFKWTRF